MSPGDRNPTRELGKTRCGRVVRGSLLPNAAFGYLGLVATVAFFGREHLLPEAGLAVYAGLTLVAYLLASFTIAPLFGPYMYLAPVIPYYAWILAVGPSSDASELMRLLAYYPLAILAFVMGFQWMLRGLRGRLGSADFFETIRRNHGAPLPALVPIAGIVLLLLRYYCEAHPEVRLLLGVGFVAGDLGKLLLLAGLFDHALRGRSFGAFAVLCVAVIGLIGFASVQRIDFAFFSLTASVSLVILAVLLRYRLYRIRPGWLILAAIIVYFVPSVVDFRELSVRRGGDLLLLENGIRATAFARDRSGYEPGMFVYNLGFYLIPEGLWPFPKPHLYNHSAWFLQNVMGYDPARYPYGVGLGGVAAGVVCGGFSMVVLIFGFCGLYLGQVFRWTLTRAPALVGFQFYLCLHLPLGMFRMDPSFFLERPLVTWPAMLLFVRYCHRRYRASSGRNAPPFGFGPSTAVPRRVPGPASGHRPLAAPPRESVRLHAMPEMHRA